MPTPLTSRVWWWLLIAGGVGFVVARVSLWAHPIDLLPRLAAAGFATLAVTRPRLAARAYVAALAAGIPFRYGLFAAGVLANVADVMLVFLLAGWALSGLHLESSKIRGFAAPVLAITVMMVGFTYLGSVRGNVWLLMQLDLFPFLHLLAFFPLAASIRDERDLRRLLAAAAVGISVASAGAAYEYFARFHASSDAVTRLGIVFGSGQGFGAGPRVTTYAHVLLPPAAIAMLLLARDPEARAARRVAFALAGLVGFALLVDYTRTLQIPAVLSLLAAILIVSRSPRRMAASLAVLAVLSVTLLVAVPVATGHPVGSAISGLQSRFTNLFSDPSYQSRAEETRAGFRVFGDHPLIGLGMGGAVIVPEIELPRTPSFFHNGYVRMLVKTGLVGTVVLFTFLVMLAIRALRSAAAASGPTRIALVAGGSWMLGLLISPYSAGYLLETAGILGVVLVAVTVAHVQSGGRTIEVEAGSPATGHERDRVAAGPPG